MKTIILMVCFIALASCASPPLPHSDIRHIRAIIATDNVGKDKLVSLVDRFNSASIDETGIVLDAQYVHWSMEEQKNDWPNCKSILPCFADAIHHYGQPYDIAILVRNSLFVKAFEVLGFPVVGAVTDTDKGKYIVLNDGDFISFKHEVYHTFHPGHSLTGLMSPYKFQVLGVNLDSGRLSEASRDEIMKNKWRQF